MILLSAPRPLSFKRCIFYNWGKQFLDNSHMDSRPFSAITKSSVSHTEEAHFVGSTDTTVSLQEWQGWGTTSPVPSLVTEIIEDLKLLQKDIDAPMSFGGNRGKLQVCQLSLSRTSSKRPSLCVSFCCFLWFRVKKHLYLSFQICISFSFLGTFLLWICFGLWLILVLSLHFL